MMTIECVRDRATKEPFPPTDSFGARLCANGLARGLVVRWQNGKVILSPPLIFTRDHVDEAIAGLDATFSATAK